MDGVFSDAGSTADNYFSFHLVAVLGVSGSLRPDIISLTKTDPTP
jgi:hypothetical protein